MNLGDELDQRLRSGVVDATDGVRHVAAEVEDADRLAVSVRGLRVRTPGRSLDDAVAVLPEAVGRALGEPLHAAEVAPTLGGAVLRSRPDADREFYEVRTSGAESTLERWRIRADGRERVAFPITRRDLRRVVEAL